MLRVSSDTGCSKCVKLIRLSAQILKIQETPPPVCPQTSRKLPLNLHTHPARVSRRTWDASVFELIGKDMGTKKPATHNSRWLTITAVEALRIENTPAKFMIQNFEWLHTGQFQSRDLSIHCLYCTPGLLDCSYLAGLITIAIIAHVDSSQQIAVFKACDSAAVSIGKTASPEARAIDGCKT